MTHGRAPITRVVLLPVRLSGLVYGSIGQFGWQLMDRPDQERLRRLLAQNRRLRKALAREREQAQRLRPSALHDTLTSLPIRALLMDRLVRQGRAFGIHVLLGSQTLGGAYTLARATMGQMVVRLAVQCNEADADLIMDENNAAPRVLSRPGEGI